MRAGLLILLVFFSSNSDLKLEWLLASTKEFAKLCCTYGVQCMLIVINMRQASSSWLLARTLSSGPIYLCYGRQMSEYLRWTYLDMRMRVLLDQSSEFA